MTQARGQCDDCGPAPITAHRTLDLLALPALDDNYIWLLRDSARRALVVDPGQSQPVIAALGDNPPLAILLTHHHGDHVGGVADLLARWPSTQIFAPQDERIPHATVHVREGDQIDIGAWRFGVLAVPGHTRSHVAYHGEGLLFCGDTLFSLGCGRMFEGSPAQMHASLARLAALPEDTLVCCAHEYTLANAAFALTVDPDNPALQARMQVVRDLRTAGLPTLPVRLAEEIACNPFLRCGTTALHIAAERYAGRPMRDTDVVFATLRGWKDRFRG